jgi:hypothetical protein
MDYISLKVASASYQVNDGPSLAAGTRIDGGCQLL